MDIYKKLAKLTEFDWDLGNSDKNFLKHKVTNSETEEVFFNSNLILPDPKHSIIEERYYLLGQTNNFKILFVAFSIRGSKIRVISSRIASRKERQVYSNFINNEKRNSKI